MSNTQHVAYPHTADWTEPDVSVTVVDTPTTGYWTADEVRLERHPDGSVTLVYRKDRRTFPSGVTGFGPATGGVRLSPETVRHLLNALAPPDDRSH